VAKGKNARLTYEEMVEQRLKNRLFGSPKIKVEGEGKGGLPMNVRASNLCSETWGMLPICASEEKSSRKESFHKRGLQKKAWPSTSALYV